MSRYPPARPIVTGSKSHDYLLPTSTAATPPLSLGSKSTGLGLHLQPPNMATPQTQSPSLLHVHGISSEQRPFWDTGPHLTLETNTGMTFAGGQYTTWDELYDPYAEVPLPPNSNSDRYFFPTPTSGIYDPTFQAQVIPMSQTSSTPSVSCPTSETHSREPSPRFLSQPARAEDQSQWNGVEQRRVTSEPRTMSDYFVSPSMTMLDRTSLMQSPAPTDVSANDYRAPRVKSERKTSILETSTKPLSKGEEPIMRLPRKSSPQTRRRRTTPENADIFCPYPGCNKPFSRFYNMKSHMDTHNPKREKPFKCDIQWCSKAFVRKTDLERHVKSIHMQTKDWVCSYCGNGFARKDTLTRYYQLRRI
ncbi:MAG: hypothetical protein M1820_000874 [Bogoriella megaspora]|nr:MAG: hypothetical protein M1820_000874 [Bogoriella megaspora]